MWQNVTNSKKLVIIGGGECALEKQASLVFMGDTIKKGNLETSIN